MRNCALFLLTCLILLACAKEQVEEYIITPASTEFSGQIKVDQVVNDSTIVLKWTKFSGEGFQKYRLVRTASYIKNGIFGSYTEPVDSSTDINQISFTETKMPVSHEVVYTLHVLKGNTPTDAWPMFVGRVAYQRPNSLVYGAPTDVLFSRQHQRLYITEQDKVSVVDLSGRVLTQTKFPVTIGYCYLGVFNGSDELYVPLNDGWVHILNAATLELKDRIYIGGFEIGSVLAAKGKLYVSSSERSFGGYSNCIKVYDRATKTLAGRTGYWDRTRLLLLEGSAVEMIDFTINLLPVGLHYYQFSESGIPLAKKEDGYHGDFQMNASIVRSFPDGSRFITSGSGTIFNKSLVFDRYVKQQGNYSDFAFNEDGSLIYAALTAEKKIDVVRYPSTTNINNYSTTYYPYKIFRDGNTLICVGKTAPTQQQLTHVLVEKVNL